MSSLRLVFAGTPEFAAITLSALIDSGHQIIAVYTQPDRPAGRGRKFHSSPVKTVALKNDIPVLQPGSLKEADAEVTLRSFQADVMVVAAYGLILPPTILAIPQFGCLNIHASLLPRWRGAAPIQHAIAAGDSESGISIMQMDAGLDTGDILFQTACSITDNDTGGSLHDRLAQIGACAVLQTLDDLDHHKIKPFKQDNSKALYAPKLDKSDAEIYWQLPAIDIERLIRAFNPWPVAYTHLNNKTLRIWHAQVLSETTSKQAGTIITCDKKGLEIACGEGVLRLLELQPAGGKAMNVAAFINGHGQQIIPNTLLGSSSAT